MGASPRGFRPAPPPHDLDFVTPVQKLPPNIKALEAQVSPTVTRFYPARQIAFGLVYTIIPFRDGYTAVHTYRKCPVLLDKSTFGLFAAYSTLLREPRREHFTPVSPKSLKGSPLRLQRATRSWWHIIARRLG